METMVIHKDICIIGGGIMGFSSAYYLAKAKKSCVVLEMADIGNGASAACDDMIMMQAKQIGTNLAFGIESLELFEGLSGELNQDVGFRLCGGMVLIDDDIQLKKMETFVARQRSMGLDVRIVENAELFRMQPNVNRAVRASTYCAQDAHIDPLLLLYAYVKNAIQRGVEVIRDATANGIRNTGAHWEVTTHEGHVVQAECVLIAAGAWSRQLGELLDVALPVRPRKGHILITEPIPALSPTHLWSAAYIASKLGEDTLGKRDPYEEQIGHGFVFSRTHKGNHLLGGSREFKDFDKALDIRTIETILRYAKHYVPRLADVHIIRTIANFRPATPDGKAIVGSVDGHPGLFVLTGHEGDGISLAPLMGKSMADMICGRAADKRFEAFNQRRFNHTGTEA
jgi:sarcosine oxidase subunit beta